MGKQKCRIEYIDGTAISVFGSAAMSPEDLDAFSEVVRAARKHVADNPPPVSQRVKSLADRIERGDVIQIARAGLKSAVAAELQRRHPEIEVFSEDPVCSLGVQGCNDWHGQVDPKPTDSTNGATS